MLAARLCRQAGIIDVETWMGSLDGTRILDFWSAVDHLEPFGLPALDQLFAVQTAHLVTCFTGKGQHPDEFRAFPDYSRHASRGQLTPEERRAKAAAEQSLFA